MIAVVANCIIVAALNNFDDHFWDNNSSIKAVNEYENSAVK